MFATTYVCEKLFSTIKIVKTKFRSRLTDKYLRDQLRLAPVLTRWKTWLDAVNYYAKYHGKIMEVIDALDSTDSSAVAAVKSLPSEQLLEDILFVDSNFKIVSKSSTMLESSKLELSEALNIVYKVSQTVIENNNSIISEKVKYEDEDEDDDEDEHNYNFIILSEDDNDDYKGEDNYDYKTEVNDGYRGADNDDYKSEDNEDYKSEDNDDYKSKDNDDYRSEDNDDYRGEDKTIKNRKTTTIINRKTTTVIEEITTIINRKTTKIINRKTTTIINRKTTTIINRKTTTIIEAKTTTIKNRKTTTIINRKIINRKTTTMTTTIIEVKTTTIRKINDDYRGEDNDDYKSEDNDDINRKIITTIIEPKTTTIINRKTTTTIINRKTTTIINRKTTTIIEAKTTTIINRKTTTTIEAKTTTIINRKMTTTIIEAKTTTIINRKMTTTIIEAKTTTIINRKMTTTIIEAKTTTIINRKMTTTIINRSEDNYNYKSEDDNDDYRGVDNEDYKSEENDDYQSEDDNDDYRHVTYITAVISRKSKKILDSKTTTDDYINRKTTTMITGAKTATIIETKANTKVIYLIRIETLAARARRQGPKNALALTSLAYEMNELGRFAAVTAERLKAVMSKQALFYDLDVVRGHQALVNRKTNGGVLHCECAAVYCQKSDSNEKTWLFLFPVPSNAAQLKSSHLPLNSLRVPIRGVHNDLAAYSSFNTQRLMPAHDVKTFIVKNPAMLFIAWFTDEAWFHLSGYVNSQNSRHWAIENPHVIHEAPMHPVKIGVWCAISAQRIVGPIFFNQTVNTADYRLIFMEFVEQLDDVELSQGYFQQDDATCHTSNESMELIASFFDNRIISRNLWPPKSPDLTTPDFFLWGYLKDRVYATRPQTLDDLKHNITQEIQAIDNRVLQRVASNIERRVELCLMEDGGHFQHLL
ncbi:hypothetical protein ANN_13819 [Periplaneta americana]|uniref:Uncharacterized protein n=1 Tax=Periplaneta americana TaxID=6978 RepID=A0ABQ8SWQ7_PERAM|nr:hypothetical protein ANN_13819 [Periplaneta americana]